MPRAGSRYVALFGVLSFCLSAAHVERRCGSLFSYFARDQGPCGPPRAPSSPTAAALCTGRAAPNCGGQGVSARSQTALAQKPSGRSVPVPTCQGCARIPRSRVSGLSDMSSHAWLLWARLCTRRCGLAHERDRPCAAGLSSGSSPAPASPRCAQTDTHSPRVSGR